MDNTEDKTVHMTLRVPEKLYNDINLAQPDWLNRTQWVVRLLQAQMTSIHNYQSRKWSNKAEPVDLAKDPHNQPQDHSQSQSGTDHTGWQRHGGQPSDEDLTIEKDQYCHE